MPLTIQIAPFRSPSGKIVLLALNEGRLVSRFLVSPFYIQFPTPTPTPIGPFPSDFSLLYSEQNRRWTYGIHRAGWPSIVYKHGTVLIAVDQEGRWVGECEVPPGADHLRRAKLALSELLATGDAIQAERIARGPCQNVFNPAVVVLMVRPTIDHA